MRDFEGYKKDFPDGSGELNRIHLKMSRLPPGAVDANRYDFETDEVLFSRSADLNGSPYLLSSNDLIWLAMICKNALIRWLIRS